MKVYFVFITFACLSCYMPHATSSVVRIAEAAVKTAKEVKTIGTELTLKGINTALSTKKAVITAIADKNKGTGSVAEVVGSAVQGAISIKQNILTKVLAIGKSILGGAMNIGAAIISNKLALMSASSHTSKPCRVTSIPAPAKQPQPPAPPAPKTPPQNPGCNPPPKPACPGSKSTKSVDNEDIGGNDNISYLPINPYSTEEVYESVQYFKK